MIGLGAGIIPRWYEQQGIRTDVVDIDPKVVEFAREYFDFSTSGEIAIEDARYYLSRTNKRYDFVILDVFNGDTNPGYLLSREAISLVKRRMSTRGILAINTVGSFRRDTLMTASVERTLRSVFDQVELYPTFDPMEGDGTGNLVVMAYMGPRRSPDSRRMSQLPVHPLAYDSVHGRLSRRFSFPDETPSMILTDDYNPIEFYDAWVRESARRNILEGTHWDILIGSS